MGRLWEREGRDGEVGDGDREGDAKRSASVSEMSSLSKSRCAIVGAAWVDAVCRSEQRSVVFDMTG